MSTAELVFLAAQVGKLVSSSVLDTQKFLATFVAAENLVIDLTKDGFIISDPAGNSMGLYEFRGTVFYRVREVFNFNGCGQCYSGQAPLHQNAKDLYQHVVDRLLAA